MHVDRSNSSSLNLEIIYSEPSFCSLAILVPATLVDALYQQAVIAQKRTTPAFGFHKRETPSAYIEQNYQTNLIEHIQEFLLKYLVMGFLAKRNS